MRALIRTSNEPNGLLINDKGFTTVEDTHNGRRGVFFPLSPNVGILVVPEIGPNPAHQLAWLATEAVWTPFAVEMMNLACWRQPRIHCVIGHPSQTGLIESLDDERPLIAPALGPYRRRGTGGMFDWAFETQ